MLSLLYVDDEPGLLEIGQVFLESTGDFSVTTALTGREGLEQITRHDFDAIISDYQMPEMDGIEFLKKVRQSFGNIPFILFTGRGREEIVIQAINHGVDFYLQKGGDPMAQFAELAHKVRQAVSRRQAETALSESEKRLADIINFLPDATFAIDTRGIIIAWNRAMERMTGVGSKEVLGKGNYEYALPFYRERRPLLIDFVLNEDPAIAAKYPFIRKDERTIVSEIAIPHFNEGRGAALWFTASPLYNRKGEVAGAIESIREITERKQAEEDLVSANREFTNLLDQIQDIYYRSDTEGRLVRASRSWATLFGFDDISECIGMSIADEFYVNPSDRKTVLEEIYRQGKITDYKVLVKKKDGTPMRIEASSHLCYDSAGNVMGVEGTFRDVTERKKAEEELSAAHEQLAASAEELQSQYNELAQSEKQVRMSETRLRYMLSFYERPRTSEKDLLMYALEGAGIITESPLGYLAFLNEDESELSMYAWSESAMAECSMQEKPIIYKTAKTGLWGEAVRQRRPVVTNDYSAPDPAKKGYPEGHPRIIRHMNVPVIDDGHIVLVAGVANKPTGYSENDVRELLLLMQGLWTILKRKRAEQIREETEAKYHDLADLLPQIVFEMDTDFKITFINRQASDALGYSQDDIVHGFSALSVIDPSQHDRIRQNIGRLAAGEAYDQREYLLVRKDGSTFPAVIYADPVYRLGELAGYRGIIIDITERERAESELRAAYGQLTAVDEELRGQYEELSTAQAELSFRRQQLEEITSTVPGVVYQFYARPDGTRGFYYVSSRKNEIFGLRTDPDEFFPAFVLGVHPDDRARFLASIEGAVKRNADWVFEGRFNKPSGDTIWFEGVSSPVIQGNELIFTGVMLDITERKRTEEALFNSQQMLQSVLDTIPQRVFWKDRNSVFLGCNKPLALDAGFGDPADIVGKTDYDHASAATADLYRADDRQVMETGQPRINYEEPQVKPDGSRAWLLTTKVPLRDKEGMIIGVLGTYEDITEKKRAEGALRESEEKYRTLVESSFDGIAIHQDGILVYVNRTAARLLGSDDTSIFVGKPALDIVAPAFRERIAERIRAAPENSQQLLHEQFQRIDGTAIDVDVTSTPGSWKGRPAAFVTFRDITEQKRAEEALRESEEKYRALVESTSDFIWEINADGTYTYVSPKVREMLGYEPDELVGKTPFDLMPPGEAELVADEFNRCVAARLPLVSIENKAFRKDGSIVILETSGIVLTGKDGSFQGYRGIDRDITRRKKAEDALREKTEELNQYFSTSLDLFCIADTEGYFRRLNPEWEKTLGYPLDELVGKRFLDYVHPDDLPATLATLADLRSQKEVINFTNRYRHRDGTYRWIEWRSSPRGNTIFAAARDITDRHLAAERTAYLSALKEELLRTAPLEEKLRRITDSIVNLFGADFARIWISGAGDLCDRDCIHATVTVGPHVCRNRASCLHLIVSSGRYTRTDGDHRRVPFGAYKIGRIASGEEEQFITNDVTHDPRVHDHAWAGSLGLKSFAGFRLVSPEGESIGVLAFFSRQEIIPEMMGYLDDLAATASQVIQTGIAERALRESEEWTRTILNTAQAGILLIDAETHRILDANSKALELIGRPKDSVIGAICHGYICPVEEGDCPVTDTGRKADTPEQYLITASGLKIPVLKTVVSVSLDDRKVLVESFVDISEQKLAEAAIREANRKLNLLTGITRHDILNKVAVVLGFLKIAEMKYRDPDLARYLEKMESAIIDIRSQIEFTRVYENIGSHEPQWIDLDTILPRSQVPEPISLYAEVQGISVFADPMLEKVFFNLLDNSVRHGQRVTRIRVFCHMAGEDLVVVWEDNGAGIPAGEKVRIFEKGYGKHTGLGLFLVREILAITGISIRETGTHGTGGRFEIIVPKGAYRFAS